MFDVPRDSSWKINWPLIESIKNGYLVNTKYKCGVKTAVHPSGTSHVFVFMNAYPDTASLSRDRWHIIDQLGDEQTIHDLFPPYKFPGVAFLVDPFHEDFNGGNALGLPRCPSPPRHRRRRLELEPPVVSLQIEDGDDRETPFGRYSEGGSEGSGRPPPPPLPPSDDENELFWTNIMEDEEDE